MTTETPHDELHTAKWIARLHDIMEDQHECLTRTEADDLISLIAKQRNSISHLRDARNRWRAKCAAIAQILAPKP